MRKIKMAIVSMLVVLTALFCLVGCGQTGKYVATAYKAGPITMDLTDSDSYVELKGDNEAVVSIDLGTVGKLEGIGTWTKGEQANQVFITVEKASYTATIEDGKMTMNIFGSSLIFTKE
jgi:predicted small lipoprotein YifL